MAEKRLHIRLMVSEDGTVKVQRLTDDIKALDKQGAATATSMTGTMGKIGAAIAGAFSVAAITEFTKSCLEASKVSEDYATRLKVLTGSQREANAVLQEAASFAARVPFEYKDIMDAATALAGVTDGTADGVMKWLPLIADLAATSGLSIQETTGQVIRMFSAGAASADLFRERGILAMLGFQAGVTYSAEETKKRLVAAWEDQNSKFRGATDELSKTMSGQISMVADAWYNLTKQIGDSIGQTAEFKAALAAITETINGYTEEVRRAGDAGSLVTTAFMGATLALGALADAYTFARQGAAYFGVVMFSIIKVCNDVLIAINELDLALLKLGGTERNAAEITAQEEHLKNLRAAADAAHQMFQQNIDTLAESADAYTKNSEAVKKLQDRMRELAAENRKAMALDAARNTGPMLPSAGRGGAKVNPIKGADATGPLTDYEAYKALRLAAWESAQSRLNIERQRMEAMKAMAADEYDDKVRKINAIAFWEREAARERERIASEEYDASLVRSEWRQRQAQAEAEDARNLALETAQMNGDQFQQAMEAAAAMQERAKAVNSFMVGLGSSLSQSIGGAFAQTLVYGKNLMSGIREAFKQLAASIIQQLIQIAAQALIVKGLFAIIGFGFGGGGGLGDFGLPLGGGLSFGKTPVQPIAPITDATLTARASAARQPTVITVNHTTTLDGEVVARNTTRHVSEGRGSYGRRSLSLVPA